MIIIYNPISPKGALISDIFAQKVFKIEPNTMMKFEDDQVAKYLLAKFAFLQEVSPIDVLKVQKEIDNAVEEKKKSPEQLQEEKLAALSPKQREVLDSVPSAGPVGKVVIENNKQKVVTPEELEGIPASGVKDKDGVMWTGNGLETDNLASMKPIIPGKTPGVF